MWKKARAVGWTLHRQTYLGKQANMQVKKRVELHGRMLILSNHTEALHVTEKMDGETSNIIGLDLWSHWFVYTCKSVLTEENGGMRLWWFGSPWFLENRNHLKARGKKWRLQGIYMLYFGYCFQLTHANQIKTAWYCPTHWHVQPTMSATRVKVTVTTVTEIKCLTRPKACVWTPERCSSGPNTFYSQQTSIWSHKLFSKKSDSSYIHNTLTIEGKEKTHVKSESINMTKEPIVVK